MLFLFIKSETDIFFQFRKLISMKKFINLLAIATVFSFIACSEGTREGEEGHTTGQRNETIIDDSDSSRAGSRKAIGVGEGNDKDDFPGDNSSRPGATRADSTDQPKR